MECYKNEAIRAKDIAEKKMESNDFDEARKIALKAQNLYPELENITQLLSICEVHCSAQKTILGSQKDWYGILQVGKFADESTVRKQYRRLALNLHPDKNSFPGAESAFKLICEANAVLSDPTKKTLYDTKVRATAVRSAPVNPPVHKNQNYQFNKQYGAMNNVNNGFSGLNQHQVPQSSYSMRQGMFWTSCSFCRMKYQYPRTLMEVMLKCQHCMRSFTAYDISAQGSVPPGPTSIPPTAYTVPVKPGVSQPAGFEGISVETSNSRDSSKWCASRKKVKLDPGVFKSTQLESETGMNKRETGNLKNKSRKKDRKHLVESSESCDTDISSDSDIDDVNIRKDLNSEPSHVQVRRSSRKRQNVTYKEGGVDDDDDEHPEHANQNETVYPEQSKDVNFEKNAKGDGKADSNSGNDSDAIIIETDSEHDSNPRENPEKDIFNCEDPEFNDFEKDRDEKCFSANQFWACYDSADGMPRFYAKVKKVGASPFELYITWLEGNPTDEAHRKWIKENLPVGCGIFRLGETEKMTSRLIFSHQLHCEKGKKRNSFIIYPRKGQVWALYRDWDLNWSSSPEDNREYKYEAVEILSGFDAVEGVRVCYLDKVGGFLYLFQRSSTDSFLVGPNELYRFSHSIPCCKMTGSEREGVPKGSIELDPAALPLNLDDLYYPGKTKMDPGAN